MTDEVIALVANDRRGPHDGQQHIQRERGLACRRICGGEAPGGEQQRITGQEREEHHARLDEHNQEDEPQRGRDAHGDPGCDGRARILEQPDQKINEPHNILVECPCRMLVPYTRRQYPSVVRVCLSIA